MLGDYYTDDTIHRQVAGWESVNAEFWGYSDGNEIDVYLDTTRGGARNLSHFRVSRTSIRCRSPFDVQAVRLNAFLLSFVMSR